MFMVTEYAALIDQEKKAFQRSFSIYKLNQHKLLALRCPATEEF